MMSSAETTTASEELMLNKKPSTANNTTISSTASTTLTRSQPIHFINANKKLLATNDSNNSRASLNNDYYYHPHHHHHHIYAPHNTSNSLVDHFYLTGGGSFGSSGKKNTQAKSSGLYLNDLINEFSNNRVSAFLPIEEIIINDQVGAKNEIVSRIFAEVQEVQEGKVDNVLRVMSFHPEFMQEFINLYNYLMYSQHGALPYDWRHYIAIMAAARHKCIYLVKQQEREFLNQNGQSAWLNHGIAHIPHKLKGLYELNKLLCHQPWLINHTHLEKILKGQFSWTVTELTMAITILTLFHSLSGFAFGCGINENYTQELSRQYEREEEENARRAARRSSKRRSKKQQQKQQQQQQKSNNNKRTVLKNGVSSRSNSSGVIGCIDGVDDTDVVGGEDQQAPDEDDTRRSNKNDEDDDYDDEDEDEDEQDDDYDDEDEDEDEEDEEEEEEEDDGVDTGDRRLIDNDEEEEDEEAGFLPQSQSRHYGGRSSRVHLRNYSAAVAANTHSTGGDTSSQNNSSSAAGSGRGRSNSTGASNRTLSNSSASSCELGIDMLLKEMQMIKSEDKPAQQQQQQQSTQSTKTTTNGVVSVSVSDSLSSSMLSSCSGTSATTPSSSSSSSSLIMIQKLRSNSPNIMAQCLSPTSISNLTAASSSGPSTITNNSPTTAASSNNNNNNTNTANQQYQQGAHDNNNNSIHHYNYHHYNQQQQQQTNTYHHHNHHHAHAHHHAATTNTNLSKDMNEIMRNNNNNEVRSKNVVKFMESSSSSGDSYHHSYHTAPQQQQQQNEQPVSAQSAIVTQKIRDYMLKYAFDADYGYQDVETSADPSLRLEYYTWENQGYITAQSVYPDICDFLDKNFQVAANMTYNTMGNVKGVDTSLFRKAVWFYTHSLFGVRHDDYDYNQIRALLKSPIRKYIKMVCTQPERITKSHYDSIMKEFAHSEKVHMNLVIMEARIQASMLYFLRAVNSYFG